MFEISIALKYLRPRWRQLSVSIISLISMIVIALVVWLIVVFFSVTQGLEKSWIHKLIALTAPIRITPTEEYYKSYYYLVDSLSSESNFTPKSIGEKLISFKEDPYDPTVDEEIPPSWPAPLYKNGKPLDLVKTAFHAIQTVPGYALTAKDYEVTGCNIKLRLLRDKNGGPALTMQTTQSNLSQACYLGSIDLGDSSVKKSLMKISVEDLNNLLRMAIVQDETDGESFQFLPPQESQAYLQRFFDNVQVTRLAANEGWAIPKSLYPSQGHFKGLKVTKKDRSYGIWLPLTEADLEEIKDSLKREQFEVQQLDLSFKDKLAYHGDTAIKSTLYLPPKTVLEAQLVRDSLKQAFHTPNVIFDVAFNLQGLEFKGRAPLGRLIIQDAEIVHPENSSSPSFWANTASSSNQELISDPIMGEGILLPKSFKEAGLLIGDRGFISYYSPTISSVQEQRQPIYISGFYDQGIISIGGKFILANSHFVNTIRTSQMQEGNTGTNGINVRLENKDLDKVAEIKKALEKAFEEEGIAAYWKIQTYEEFDFTKDILQQLRSDKTLFLIIATVIIIVACSNIISMLIILVNDKKLEIGILRSMGASSLSIGAIFGLCGIVIGIMGSLLGTLAAAATLKNLDVLVYVLSKFQGRQAFNPLYYGDSLPNQMSFEAALFVMISTIIISLISGLVPAVKAGMLRPSTVLRSE